MAVPHPWPQAVVADCFQREVLSYGADVWAVIRARQVVRPLVVLAGEVVQFFLYFPGCPQACDGVASEELQSGLARKGLLLRMESRPALLECTVCRILLFGRRCCAELLEGCQLSLLRCLEAVGRRQMDGPEEDAEHEVVLFCTSSSNSITNM